MSPGCTWGALLLAALLLQPALSSPDFRVGARFAVRLPGAYQPGFTGRTTMLEAAGQRQPRFAAAVSAEAGTGGGYLCSLVVLLANVTVWASGRPDQEFAARAVCQLELTADGQLRLTDGAMAVVWWSGTAGQGAKVLRLDSKTGNLRLLDDKKHTVWQSFDKPTDKLLPGQWLRVPSYFTVSPAKISSPFYSVELDTDKIGAYIYFGEQKYSYWELAPNSNQAMAFAGMDESGLTMYDQRRRPVAKISPAVNKGPVRFLALGDDGSLGLYAYDSRHGNFTPSYEALAFCDLPLACGVLGVCSLSGSCRDFAARGVRPAQGGTLCNATATSSDALHDMVEVRGVTTVLRADSPLTNVPVQQCVDLCLRDCSCAAALHVKDDAVAGSGVCSHYELTAGAREVIGGEDGQRHSYWVKVLKGSKSNCREDEEDYDARNEALNKILIIFGVVDVIGLLLFGGLCVYFICLRGRTADEHVCEEDGEAAGHDRGAAEPDRNANNSGAVQDS
ncbi:unnamed protein product [Triticum turgidum subsp. durum]|uniref:non-specific serine/threonine protein kinase n=1 Tax=Triticum turgidum subsp. durum TaxID=4567 RepID=A0A9R1QPM9_TRITD|nr:unnamed protein product [Triticum turgidum subsp. durum]